VNAWNKLVTRLSRLIRPAGVPDTTRPIDSRIVINRIVSQTVRLNLLFMTGKTISVEVRHREYRDLAAEISGYHGGYLLSAVGESGGRRCGVLLPPAMVTFLVETILRTHQATIPDEDLALVRCMEWLDGNLSRLFFIDDLRPARFHRVVSRISSDQLESVLWQASDSSLVSFTFEGFSGYLIIDAAVHRQLTRDLQDGEFRRAVRSLVVTELVPDAEGDVKREDRDIQFFIERSHEFSLGTFFIPETFTTGGRTFHAVYESVIIPVNYREWLESAILTRTVDLKVNETWWRLVYTLTEPKLDGLLEAIGSPDSFFQAAIAGAGANLNGTGGALQVSCARYPIEPAIVHPMDLEDPVLLEARVHVHAGSMRMLVFVPRGLINALCRAILSPEEILFLLQTGRNQLIAVLALNEVLFRRGFADQLPKQFLDLPQPGEAGVTVPFHDLVEFFGDADLKIITQNFLLPRFGEKCVCLFNVQTPFVVNGEERTITYHPVLHRNFDRIAPFLPDSFRTEEEIVLRNYARINDFERLNFSAVAGLYRAITEDRLVVLIADYEFLRTERKAGRVDTREIVECMQKVEGAIEAEQNR